MSERTELGSESSTVLSLAVLFGVLGLVLGAVGGTAAVLLVPEAFPDTNIKWTFPIFASIVSGLAPAVAIIRLGANVKASE